MDDATGHPEAETGTAGPAARRIEGQRRRVAQNPDAAGPRHRLAEMLKAEGRLAEAETVIRETAELFPNNRRAKLELQALAPQGAPSVAPARTAPNPTSPARPAPAAVSDVAIPVPPPPPPGRTTLSATANQDVPGLSAHFPTFSRATRTPLFTPLAPPSASPAQLPPHLGVNAATSPRAGEPRPIIPLDTPATEIVTEGWDPPGREWLVIGALALLFGGLWAKEAWFPPKLDSPPTQTTTRAPAAPLQAERSLPQVASNPPQPDANATGANTSSPPPTTPPPDAQTAPPTPPTGQEAIPTGDTPNASEAAPANPVPDQAGTPQSGTALTSQTPQHAQVPNAADETPPASPSDSSSANTQAPATPPALSTLAPSSGAQTLPLSPGNDQKAAITPPAGASPGRSARFANTANGTPANGNDQPAANPPIPNPPPAGQSPTSEPNPLPPLPEATYVAPLPATPVPGAQHPSIDPGALPASVFILFDPQSPTAGAQASSLARRIEDNHLAGAVSVAAALGTIHGGVTYFHSEDRNMAIVLASRLGHLGQVRRLPPTQQDALPPGTIAIGIR